MKIEECRIGQRVRNPSGQDATIVNISNSGQVHVDYGPGCYHYAPAKADDLTPVSDPCQGCEMAMTVAHQREQIVKLQKSLDEMTCKSNAAHRNARHWREELEKLQRDGHVPAWDGGASCEMAATITNQCQQIAKLQIERDGWKSAADAYSSLKDDYRSRLAESRRHVAYLREELIARIRKEMAREFANVRD